MTLALLQVVTLEAFALEALLCLADGSQPAETEERCVMCAGRDSQS